MYWSDDLRLYNDERHELIHDKSVHTIQEQEFLNNMSVWNLLDSLMRYIEMLLCSKHRVIVHIIGVVCLMHVTHEDNQIPDPLRHARRQPPHHRGKPRRSRGGRRRRCRPAPA